MKNLLVVVWLVVTPVAVQAQQIGVNSLYHNNISYYNPAFTASEYQLRGGLQYRNQWSNLEGNPVSYFAQYEHRLDSIHSGIGVTYMRDEVLFATFQSAVVNYSYELYLSQKNRLFFGLSVGAINTSFDPYWVLYDPNDPQVPGKAAQTKLVVNTGALLKLNRFKLGMSALRLNRPNYDELNFRSQLHVVLTADYKWLLTRKFNLEPSVFFISDTHYMSLTTLLRANYTNKFWGMVGYRFDDGIVFGAGVVIHKRFSLGYNLDLITSKLSNITRYSHGIYFNYQIKRPSGYPFKGSVTPYF